MSPRMQRVPSVAVELLRLLVVVAGAAIGFEVGRSIGPTGSAESPVVSLYGSALIGTVVGAGLGFSIGGVISRSMLKAVDRGERALDGLEPDQVVAGAIGAVVSTFLVALLSWPILLVGRTAYMVPVFMFIVLVAALFGFRVGRNRRAAMLNALGSTAGMAPRGVSASALIKVLDTSAAIDGRIVDVVKAGFLHGRMLLPTPVLGELQLFADSADDMRRSKGRRGLQVLEQLRTDHAVELEVIADEAPDIPTVDAKLVAICKSRSAALITLDSNLSKVANLAGVRVLDLHQLALAMKPPVVVGELLRVVAQRPGREAGQALAHLEDGTLIVIENGRDRVGQAVTVSVSSVITTGGGRMVFAGVVPEQPQAQQPQAEPPQAQQPQAPASARPTPPPPPNLRGPGQ